MISAGTIAALESGPMDCAYILGARMRSVKEVSERVLADRRRYQEVTPEPPDVQRPFAVECQGGADRRPPLCRLFE